MSIDGYVADERGRFDWRRAARRCTPLVDELSRPVGTCLLGRRMYDALLGCTHDDVETHRHGRAGRTAGGATVRPSTPWERARLRWGRGETCYCATSVTDPPVR